MIDGPGPRQLRVPRGIPGGPGSWAGSRIQKHKPAGATDGLAASRRVRIPSAAIGCRDPSRIPGKSERGFLKKPPCRIEDPWVQPPNPGWRPPGAASGPNPLPQAEGLDRIGEMRDPPGQGARGPGARGARGARPGAISPGIQWIHSGPRASLGALPVDGTPSNGLEPAVKRVRARIVHGFATSRGDPGTSGVVVSQESPIRSWSFPGTRSPGRGAHFSLPDTAELVPRSNGRRGIPRLPKRPSLSPNPSMESI